MPHYSKADLAAMAKTNPLGARALVLANSEQFVRDGFIGDPLGTPPAAAPVAPPVSNPPAAPAVLSAREQWRADIERFSRSTVLAEQVHARRLVLQGEPPEPAPAAPAPPTVPT